MAVGSHHGGRGSSGVALGGPVVAAVGCCDHRSGDQHGEGGGEGGQGPQFSRRSRWSGHGVTKPEKWTNRITCRTRHRSHADCPISGERRFLCTQGGFVPAGRSVRRLVDGIWDRPTFGIVIALIAGLIALVGCSSLACPCGHRHLGPVVGHPLVGESGTGRVRHRFGRAAWSPNREMLSAESCSARGVKVGGSAPGAGSDSLR